MQWGHGDEAVEEGPLLVPLESEPHGFNGATAMKPWKRPTSRSDVATTCLLQWGHGDEAVEEILVRHHKFHVPQASMGPRR